MHYNLDTFFIKKPNSLSYKARYLLRMSLGSGGGRSVCLWRCRLLSVPWESRPQEGGGIAQAWTTWSEGASAPNGTVKCRGHGVPEMVTPASRTTAVLLVF